MDYEEAPSEPGREPPGSRSSRRRSRTRSQRSSDRVAAAAKEAFDGLEGVPRLDHTDGDDTPRSPGVRVLFEPAPPAASTAPTLIGKEPHGPQPSEGEAATSRVWNPFRQATPDNTPRYHTASGATLARPRISHLHTRRSATETTVIATVEHSGRRAHGTAVGSPIPQGALQAVAEATVAALRMVADGPVPVAVDQVTRSPDGQPATVSVIVTWSDARGRQRLVGDARLQDDPERAVMQATLDAVGRRLPPSLGPAEQETPATSAS